MKEARPLEQVIADWREDAQAARRIAQEQNAELIERVVRDFERATADYRRELSEEAAMNWSGRTREWLRTRFPAWKADGHAWTRGGKRYYRACVVPRRLNMDEIRQDAKEAANA